MALALRIKYKGYNKYTDYTELYIHNTLEKSMGLHLVKNKEKADVIIAVIYMGDEKSLYFISGWFKNLEKADFDKIAAAAEIEFKSEALFVSVDYEGFKTEALIKKIKIEPNKEPNVAVYPLFFSYKYNAFNETAFITEGDSLLANVGYYLGYKTGKPYAVSYINYGGITKGLTLYIDGAFVENDELEFNGLCVIKRDYKVKEDTRIEKSIILEKVCENGVYRYKSIIPDFVIPEGINKESAKLRFKKGYNEKHKRQFYFWFMLEGESDKVYDIKFTALPHQERL